MDKKFYITLEAARLLKEKGYNEYCDYYYVEGENRNIYVSDYVNNESFAEWRRKAYTSPTKAEVIDWLDSKGIVVEVFHINRAWAFSTFNCKSQFATTSKYDYKTRLEAEDAAIIKALKML